MQTFSKPFPAQYVVDVANQRHVVELGESEVLPYAAGDHVFEQDIPKVDLSGIKKHALLNVGLLTITFLEGEEELVEIKLVTQVSKNREKRLIRTVFNPLE